MPNMPPYQSYTELAANIVKHLINQAPLVSEITGSPTSLQASNVHIITGNDFDKSEGIAFYIESPILHDIGINNAGNVIQRELQRIPIIAEHFKYNINGITGDTLREHVKEALTQAGITPELQQPILQWEGFNDHTPTPHVLTLMQNDEVYLNISPEIEAPRNDGKIDKKAKKGIYKQFIDTLENKQSAIKESVVQRASMLRNDDGTPLFSQQDIAELENEVLLVDSDSKFYHHIAVTIGKLKDKENVSDNMNADKTSLKTHDTGKTVLAKYFSHDAIKDLLLDAVLDHVPELYPHIANPDRIKADMQKLVGDTVDLTPIFQHAQFDNDLWTVASNDEGKRGVTIDTPHSDTQHGNMLRIDYNLPLGVKATDVTRNILAYGKQHGLIQDRLTVPETKRPRDTHPNTHIEQSSLLGKIKKIFGLDHAPAA